METWLPDAEVKEAEVVSISPFLAIPFYCQHEAQEGPDGRLRGLEAGRGGLGPPGSVFHTGKMVFLGHISTQLHQPPAGWDF